MSSADYDARLRAEAVADFVNRQSVLYRKHSGDAVYEDMVLAVSEFGVPAEAFYDDPEEAQRLRDEAE